MITATSQPVGDQRLDDLAQIIAAYNQVTEKMQASHEALEAEVGRLRLELASTNAQLQRSRRLSALGEMAAGIAHEIRNPLAAIQLYAGMAIEDLGEANDAKTAEAADAVRRIASAVQGLSAIVNDVLAFAGRAVPRPRPVPASDLLGRAIQAHLPAIEAASVTVIRCDVQHAPQVVAADPDLLQQALLNVVRNAVDAMADQSQRRVMTVDVLAADDGQVAMSIRDSGPGIEAEAIDRIFNPFFTTRGTGTGLGLAIVHRIVDAHGGAIRVFNHPDGGAVFELLLPAADNPDPDADGEDA